MTAPELKIDVEQLLGLLDRYAKSPTDLLMHAATVIRELRGDFLTHADTHSAFCPRIGDNDEAGVVCTCGLDAARARWAGSKEKK